MNDRDKILDKIKKCLALAASSNPHEAEAAFRQARKLMELHGISDLDVQASQAEERRARAGAEAKPSNWETALASKIADAFGCKVIFSPGRWTNAGRQPGEWCYVGCGAAPEVAQYAFAVLHRQARRSREAHIKSRLKRCKPAIKTRRADLFSDGWVRAVAGTIAAFVANDQQEAAIGAYMATHYPSLAELASLNRNDGRKLRDHDYHDLVAGHESGRNAQLSRGVAGGGQVLALG